LALQGDRLPELERTASRLLLAPGADEARCLLDEFL